MKSFKRVLVISFFGPIIFIHELLHIVFSWLVGSGYCGIEFSSSENNRKNRQSWEHIINDIKLNGPENIALCCVSCNASKGKKSLKDWMNGKYCKKKTITFESVSPLIKKFLLQNSTH